MQSTFIKSDEQGKNIVIQLSAESAFFKNKIEETKGLWLPILANHFPSHQGITFIPRPQEAIKAPLKHTGMATTAAKPTQGTTMAPQTPIRKATAKDGDFLIIKDPLQWPKTNLVLKFFAGKVKKV